MRYGKMEIAVECLKQLLCLDGNDEMEGHRRITDLPDDTEIKTIEYDSNRNVLVLILSGSGSPLKKVIEGAVIPTIPIEYETIEKESI